MNEVIICALPNSEIADDLEWPQMSPIFTFWVFLHIFGTNEIYSKTRGQFHTYCFR